MKSIHTATVTTALVLAALFLLPSVSANEQEWEGINAPETLQTELVPGQYIVMLKKNKDAVADTVMKKYGLAGHKKFGSLGGFAGKLTKKQADDLSKDDDVALVEPDYIVRAFQKAPKVTAVAQSLPTGVNRVEADKSPTAKINGVDERVQADIAILDTGVLKSHKDLNVVSQVNFSTSVTADDRNGHGTHTAGTAAAKDNGEGVVGVAPGARIWSVKVLGDNGSGYLSDVIEGIDYVTARASTIEVANMSLGCNCPSTALDTALTRSIAAGVVYTVAAGNSAADSTNFNPANHPGVIAVSAIADFNGVPGGGAPATCYSDVDDTFANFSNYGAPVDIAAPGVCINSTWKDGRYKVISGTSMASPHVAGAVALYLATHAKPTTALGVDAVKAAVVGAGTPQASTDGFSGDPDTFPEPLLNVQSF